MNNVPPCTGSLCAAFWHIPTVMSLFPACPAVSNESQILHRQEYCKHYFLWHKKHIPFYVQLSKKGQSSEICRTEDVYHVGQTKNGTCGLFSEVAEAVKNQGGRQFVESTVNDFLCIMPGARSWKRSGALPFYSVQQTLIQCSALFGWLLGRRKTIVKITPPARSLCRKGLWVHG